MEEFGMNPIVSRAHSELGEVYLAAIGLNQQQLDGVACIESLRQGLTVTRPVEGDYTRTINDL